MSGKLTVYADLNCPFCFVQHERMRRQGLLEAVDWHCIVHMEHLEDTRFQQRDVPNLIEEINCISSRAPDVQLNLPALRPPTQQATALLYHVEIAHPEKTIAVRAALYDALWREGRQIHLPETLNDICTQLGLPACCAQPHPVTDELRRRQLSWQQPDLNQRIPLLQSRNGNVLFGLQHPDNIRQFILGAEVEQTSEGVCVARGSTDCWMFPFSDTSDVTVKAVGDLICASFPAYRTSTHPGVRNVGAYFSRKPARPEFFAVVVDKASPEAVQFIGDLWEHSQSTDSQRPVFVFTGVDDQQFHAALMSNGASDVLDPTMVPELVRSRVRRQLTSCSVINTLTREATRDGLTGLLNRKKFDGALAAEWNKCLQANEPLSLLIIDVDYFKLYNDHFGHAGGDEVLMKVASLLASALRSGPDKAFRYGGEEFVILLPGCNLTQARRVAERARASIEQENIPHTDDVPEGRVTVSVGGASMCPGADLSHRQLFALADNSLYRAKNDGRNCHVIVDSAAEQTADPAGIVDANHHRAGQEMGTSNVN